jgi:large conductance mechanosensitive channel
MEVLNKIEELEKIKKSSHSFFSGLLTFLKEYSVLGLAIGLIIGQASKDLVDSMVGGIFMPFVQLIISKDKFDGMNFIFRGVSFNFGGVLSTFLSFLIIMFLLYFIVKKIIKNDSLLEKKK